MAWIPIHQSSAEFEFYPENNAQRVGSVITANNTTQSGWLLETFNNQYRYKITILNYSVNALSGDPADFGMFSFESGEEIFRNEASTPSTNWEPSPIESENPAWVVDFVHWLGTGNAFITYEMLIEVWEGDTPDPPPGPSGDGFHVYEIDKGWSFDGAYIPHFAELNWYFGEDPFTDKSIQKVRIHGLSKGRTFLSMAVAGMQVDYDRDFTEPQHIDLPLNAAHISTEFIPTTNYVDSSNWGVSLQLRFEGRNTDLARPEPSHVLQVLALQGSPQGNGARNN